MKRLIIPRILIVMFVTCGTPLLDAGDPVSKDDSRPGGNTNKLLTRDAPVAVLIEALKSGDFSTSIRPAEFLGDHGEAAKEVVPALVKALEVNHLRETVLHSVMQLGPHASAAIPALFKALMAEQPATRWLAAHALANIGKAAIPTLKKGAGSDNVYERLWCHAVLARIEGPNSPHLQVLAKAMASDDKTASREAIECLGMIGLGAKTVLPQIIAAMDRPAAPNAALADLLYRIGPDAAPAIPKLVALLDQSDFMTRLRREALSRIGGDLRPATPGLIRMLTAEEGILRETAAGTLGLAGPASKQAVPALINRIHDKDERVRAAAAMALGQIDPTDATVQKALVEAMKDESGRVRWPAQLPYLQSMRP